MHPNLRRAIARRREVAQGLRGCRCTLEEHALRLDLVDLLRRIGEELVAELLGEVVRALVLELGVLGPFRGLIGRAVRLHLVHDDGEVVHNRGESLQERKRRHQRFKSTCR